MNMFDATRAQFSLPEGVIYLDGNSLGPLPSGVAARINSAVSDEWGEMLITGWNKAGWIDLPMKVGNRIARLIGAPQGSVVVADSTSVNLHKALSGALSLRPDRRIILSDSGNFPTDLYVAQSLAQSLGRGHEVQLAEPEDVAGAIDDDVAVLMLTQVDFRTGRRHDMAELTKAAHAAGALVIWDLAHSAGAFAVDIAGVKADFAIGCSYKYLNGGPGAPAFIYVRDDHIDRIAPTLGGWMGHADMFAFDREYRPAPGIARMCVGTPPILGLSAFDAALDVWDDIDMNDVRAGSVELCELFISEVERRCGGYGVELVSPRDAKNRGSQVSFRFEEGYAAMQALIARNVIGDFRAPDVMRFGFAPLYNTADEVVQAAEILEDILGKRLWDRPEFKTRAKVT